MVGVDGGPDRGWSWVIAFACCFSSLILAGIFRTSGVLFVVFISDFGVTREEASWPMVLCISVLNLTGPFSSILSRKFGGRPIIITGAVVAALGISACYLTTSLKIITICFGGVFGVGYGFMNTTMPSILNAYFLNLRATANGIAYSGSCIGSIILPIAYEHFIYNYGLSGCFLLTGGIVLHIAIAGTLMRPPPWMSKNAGLVNYPRHEKPVLQKEIDFLTIDSQSKDSKFLESTCIQSPLIENSKNFEHRDEVTFDGVLCSIDMKSSPLIDAEAMLCDESQLEHPEENGESIKRIQAQKDLNRKEEHSKVPSDYNSGVNKQSADSETPDGRNRKICPTLTCTTLFQDHCDKLYVEIVPPFKTVLTCPMFYVTAITNVSFYFLYHMYVVIVVDYALDRDVPDSNTKYILFAFSLSDLFGRLCLGWVTDRQFVSRTRFVMGCMVLIGVVFFGFPFAKGYWSLLVLSSCYGLLLGCTMVLFPILLVDFSGIELHTVSYGCMCFMNGLASFGRPFLIGYFRDSVGSYSSMFYVLGTISVVSSMLWLLEGPFQRKQDKTLTGNCT